MTVGTAVARARSRRVHSERVDSGGRMYRGTLPILEAAVPAEMGESVNTPVSDPANAPLPRLTGGGTNRHGVPANFNCSIRCKGPAQSSGAADHLCARTSSGEQTESGAHVWRLTAAQSSAADLQSGSKRFSTS